MITRLALSNLQTFIKPQSRKLRALAGFVLQQEGYAKSCTLSLALVDDSAITALNNQYLSHDYATDVLSFNLLDEADLKLPQHGSPLLGEIIISGETAFRQASQFKLHPHEELEHLLVHGILHLLNYEDSTPKFRNKMEERTQKLLKDFKNSYDTKKIY
jgi:probable rRNA maturation factor